MEPQEKTNAIKIKFNHLIFIIIIVVAIIIGGLCLLSNNMWKSSGNHGKSVTNTTNNNTNNSSSTNNSTNKSENQYEKQIIDKWKATLPLNNTNGLECAVYGISKETLYLKYNSGVCIIDENDEVNRYMEGDSKYISAQINISNAKNGNSGYVYMTVEEFESIIGNDNSTKSNTKTTTTTSTSSSSSTSTSKGYSSIYTGMSYYEVYSILGEPASTTRNTDMFTTYVWTTQEGVIVIQFMNGQVYQKSMH